MSGHSKWNTIKRKKEKTDAQRSKIFTKIGRELTVAVKEKGPDSSTNFKLRECISKAKSFNVPNENIERIIKKACSSNSIENYESIIYEGYAPGGVAFIVDILTNNRNRTASNIRKYFDKIGGNLGSQGCVSFMFNYRGLIEIKKENLSEEKLINESIELGAIDFQYEDESFFIMTEKENYYNIKMKLQKIGYNIINSQITMIPDSYIKVNEQNSIEKIKLLMDNLENDEDVQNVWCNYEFEN